MTLIPSGTHETCGEKSQIVITRMRDDINYEGYCANCGESVFGFLVRTDGQNENVLPSY